MRPAQRRIGAVVGLAWLVIAVVLLAVYGNFGNAGFVLLGLGVLVGVIIMIVAVVQIVLRQHRRR